MEKNKEKAKERKRVGARRRAGLPRCNYISHGNFRLRLARDQIGIK